MVEKTSSSGKSWRRGKKHRRLLLEVSLLRDPEALMELADEAMKIMEHCHDEIVEEMARGQLAMSYVVYKFWLFFMPPHVEVEYVFEVQRYADEFAEEVGKLIEVERTTRNIGGKEYPSVRLDWSRWHTLRKSFNAPADPLDLIAENFTREKNPRKALKQLMRDLLLFITATNAQVDFAEKP